MKGDFSRDSFDPLRRFSRVLMQQGRVQLDADWNEQVAIQLHFLRRLAADLIGPHGGPGGGFRIQNTTPPPDPKPIHNDFVISQGRYYVDGWLCENDQPVFYRAIPSQPIPSQPHLPQPPPLQNGTKYLAYLDVWERHVSSAEADGPIEIQRRQPTLLRELALGGPDTATRAQVIWQVKVSDRMPGEEDIPDPPADVEWPAWVQTHWDAWVDNWQPRLRGRLQVRTAKTDAEDDKNPCVIPPESRYRGLENQLYRVEIHRGGPARPPQGPPGGAAPDNATFKWSRENGSPALAVALNEETLTLADWWRDDRFGLAEGDYVEVAHDASSLDDTPPNTLRRVMRVDHDALTVTLDDKPGLTGNATHPVLRRWDHRQRTPGTLGAPELAGDNALYVDEAKWLTLEDGIQIWFDKSAPDHQYRTGDYWLIPARTGIGDVLWPKKPPPGLEPEPLPPHGVEHHYAPLAIITTAGDGTVTVVNLRRELKPLEQP